MEAHSADDVRRELHRIADPRIAEHSAGYFKTGPGEYGEGDRFLGIRVPEQRKIARRFRTLPLPHVETLLTSEYHEERLTALLILVEQFRRGNEAHREAVFDVYMRNLERVNNWDLVDTSAPHIVGAYLQQTSRALLYELAAAENLWKRRVAVLATSRFIGDGDFDDTLRLAEMLLDDGHDLLHKAVGWMLREVGNRDRATLETFLSTHHARMPRTMLRYAIEKLPDKIRTRYLIR